MSDWLSASAPGAVGDSELGDIGLFSSLAPTTLNAISRRAVVRHFAAQEHIVYEDDLCEAAYFVLSGQVRVYRVSPEGREQVLVRLKAGQAFNTVPPFQDDGRNQASALAMTETTLLVLLKEDFLELVLSHQDLAMAIFRDFADRLVHLTGLVESLALYTVQQRLIRFLLQQADEAVAGISETDKPGARSDRAARRWTQQDIAIHLGTVRDVVGRALRSLEDDGLIRLDRGRITLVDRDELERRANS